MHFSNCENCHWTVTYQNIPERDNKLSRPLVSFSSEFCFRFLQAICWCYFTLGEIGLAISRQLCLRRAHKQAFQRWREIHPQRSRDVRPTHRSQMDMDFVLSVFFVPNSILTLALTVICIGKHTHCKFSKPVITVLSFSCLWWGLLGILRSRAC